LKKLLEYIKSNRYIVRRNLISLLWSIITLIILLSILDTIMFGTDYLFEQLTAVKTLFKSLFDQHPLLPNFLKALYLRVVNYPPLLTNFFRLLNNFIVHSYITTSSFLKRSYYNFLFNHIFIWIILTEQEDRKKLEKLEKYQRWADYLNNILTHENLKDDVRLPDGTAL